MSTTEHAPATVMNTVKLLAIAAVTVAVTLLCIRSGLAMAKTSSSPSGAATVRPSDGMPEVAAGPRRLLATVTANDRAAARPVANASSADDGVTEVIGLTAKHRPDGPRPVKNVTHLPPVSGPTARTVSAPAAAGERTNGSSDGQAGGRSLGGGPTYGRHAVGQRPVAMASVGREPPLVAKLQRNNAIDHRNDDGGDDVDAKVIVDTGIYRFDNRPNNNNKNMYKQTGHHSTVDADVSVAEEDGSAGYQNSYDLTYNAGGGHQPSSYNPIHGRPPYGSAVAAPSSPAFAYPQPPPYTAPGYGRPARPQRVNGYYGPPQMSGYHHIAVQQPYYGGQTEHLNVNSNLQLVQMIYDKVDWHKLGILALFKVGLAKLKAFGFLKILFLLVFKLKMFLIAVFFKFLLITKLIKFAKLMMVPLILLMLMPLMSTLASPMLVGGLLSIPQRILEYLTSPVYAPAAAAAAIKYSAAAADPAAVQPAGTSSAKDTGGNSGGSSSSSVTVSGSSSSSPALASSRPDETYQPVQVRRRLDSLKMIDPSLNVFQKVLDSEKCVERIACRMAVVEKVGILPVWINWVLHRVSKYISNEKLESYLRTYDDVNDELYSKMETTDNWAKWCFDRYDCNNINNITNYRLMNVTDPKP